MQRVMDKLAPIIETFIKHNTGVQRLHEACGDSPSKQPPAESVIAEVRAQVGNALGLSPGDCELHAPSARWRYTIIQAVIDQGLDPDKAMGILGRTRRTYGKCRGHRTRRMVP